MSIRGEFHRVEFPLFPASGEQRLVDAAEQRLDLTVAVRGAVNEGRGPYPPERTSTPPVSLHPRAGQMISRGRRSKLCMEDANDLLTG
jgi:hypothetical protein